MSDRAYTSEGLDPAMKQMVSETLDKMEENEEAKDKIPNDPR